MTLVGYSVLVALPAINGAWVDQLGFTEVEVNRVASSDLLGLFIGAVGFQLDPASLVTLKVALAATKTILTDFLKGIQSWVTSLYITL